MSAMLPVAYSIVLFLSGAVCGFFIWVWYRNSDDAHQAEFRRHSQKFRDAIKREQEDSAELQMKLRERTLQLQTIDRHNHEIASKLKKTQTLFLQRDNAMKIATRRSDVTLKLLEEQQAAHSSLKEENEFARLELQTARDNVALLQQERDELQRECDKLQRERTEFGQQQIAVETTVESPIESTGPIAAQPVVLKVVFDDSDVDDSDVDDSDVVDAQEKSRSIENHKAELSYDDPVLGKLYRSRPSDVDDLKQIAGIAETLEKKLHEQGIFTFEQIMHWDEQAIVAFSSLLDTFQDRVERNNWVAQARHFHENKIGHSEKESPAA